MAEKDFLCPYQKDTPLMVWQAEVKEHLQARDLWRFVTLGAAHVYTNAQHIEQRKVLRIIKTHINPCISYNINSCDHAAQLWDM